MCACFCSQSFVFGAVGWVAKEPGKDKPININRNIAQMCVRVSALNVLFLFCLFCFLLLVGCLVWFCLFVVVFVFCGGFVCCYLLVRCFCWFVVVVAAFVFIFLIIKKKWFHDSVRSWMTHRTISRSSQCPTTGLRKSVVSTILSVKLCI